MPPGVPSARTCAKQTRPSAKRCLRRERLFSRIDSARRTGRALWVWGPPGSGKTILVASWLETRRVRAVWLRVDEYDADLAVFLRELAIAAGRFDRRALALQPAAPAPTDDPATIARRFFRNLFALLPARCAVVLDDVDGPGFGPSVLTGLRAAIEELPDDVFLAIVARGAAPPALARLRVHGTLATLGGAELSATAAEALALARLQRRKHTPARVEALRRKTQGWMAGLVLGLARNACEPVSGAGRRDIFDYFAGEILDRLVPEERQLLMEAALLDAPSASLVERAAGRSGAGAVLQSLARRGLFVLPHEDGSRTRYELHALFREFLLARGAIELPPGRAGAVRRAAAALLAASGPHEADDALSLLAAAGAEDELTELVKREAARLLGEGRVRELSGWLSRLSRSRIDEDPWLTLWEAATRITIDPAGAGKAAERAFERFERDGDAAGAWLAWSAATEAILLYWTDFSDVPRRLEQFERLQARHPFPTEGIRIRVTLVALAAFGHHAPSHRFAEAIAESARSLALSSEPPQVRLVAGSYWMLYANWWFGAFERSRPVVEALASLARDPDTDPSGAILWLTMEAPFHAALGDEEAAARCAEEGRALSQSTGVHVWDLVLHVQGLWSAFRVGDLARARRHLSAMRGHARPGLSTDLAMIRGYEATLALRVGDLTTALSRAEEALAAADRTGYIIPAVMAELVSLRAHSLRGDAKASEAAGRRLRQRLSGLRSPCFDQVLALLEAEHLLRFGGVAEAAGALARALAHGDMGISHARYFLGPADLAAILGAALEADVECATALELASVLSLPAPPGAGAEWPRELRVRLLGAPAVERNGNDLLVGPRVPQKPLQLLRALVALGGRGIPDLALAEALWPDADGDAAHHALETTLYRLRQLVGPSTIVQRGGQISVDRDRCWVDLLELEERLVRLCRASRERPPTAEELARVHALLRGPAFALDGELPWAVEGRSRLRKSLSRAIDALASLPIDEAALETLLERVAEIDPAAVPARLRVRSVERSGGRARAASEGG
jgi:ATP/maltotriose-dependent transcriptional regulator MalT/DNA-binding SARP family transcriptional activator